MSFAGDLSRSRGGALPASTVKRPQQPTLIRGWRQVAQRMGMSEDDVAAVARVEGEPYVTHAEFERARSADGQVPADCEGMLRITRTDGAVWEVCCDACRFEVGLHVAEVAPDRLLEHQLAQAGIPEMFAGKEFGKDSPDQREALEACRIWIRGFRKAHLADAIPAPGLFGRPGTGKSHLLSLIVETLVRNSQVDALYRTEGDLFDELQAGLRDGGYEIRWERALRVPVLALDDLGAGRWTEWRRDRLQALVDYRYSKGLPLLISTNVPPPGWDSKFGDRAASRLRGMCLRLELRGKDRRDTGQMQMVAG